MSKGSGIRALQKFSSGSQAAQYSVWSQQQNENTDAIVARHFLLLNGDNLLLNGNQVINTNI